MDLETILQLFQYDSGHPLIFTDGLFLGLFSVFMLIYAAIWNKDATRTVYIITFGFFFYYLSSGGFVFMLLLTITLDYLFAGLIDAAKKKWVRKLWLTIGILFSLSFLLYFKYKNFFLETVSDVTGNPFELETLILPIGISFYTFQSISFLVDLYKRRFSMPDFHDYLLYMTFFPHLVAGPIVRAKDFLPQLSVKPVINMAYLNEGLYLITKGFLKKAVVADHVSQYSDAVFSAPASFSGFEHIFSTLCYTLQIYCDFSGYTDMAIGIALLMGYRLCMNFDSPYKSTSITEFWRRWHISLSSWLRDYIYIPMGGNRKGFPPQLLFLVLTMLIGGFWHGADWKFVFWGVAHGLLLVIHKLWTKYVPIKSMGIFWSMAGWVLTFACVALLWVPFRAVSYADAMVVYNAIWMYSDPTALLEIFQTNTVLCCVFLIAMILVLIPFSWKNRMRVFYEKTPVVLKFVFLALAIQTSIQITDAEVQPFIYFQF
ncbi:MAG: MBOAT family O-acyltransferase [Bacteroidota bacterium]|jgi:D-alanyl-lipoteichoic acid acyltransferase DltB (MBOAT superfamily)